jgi:hypothetical protein
VKSRKEIEEKLKIIKGLLEYLRNTNMHKDEIDYFSGAEHALEWVLGKRGE